MNLEVIGADGKSRGFVEAVEGMETMKGKVTKVTAKTISINGKQIRINPPSIRPSKVPKGAKLLKKASRRQVAETAFLFSCYSNP
jgi:hypothetical protein